MIVRTTTPNRLRWRTIGDGHDGKQRQQRRVDDGFYGCLPSCSRLGSASRPRRSSVSIGRMPSCRHACASACVTTGAVKKNSASRNRSFKRHEAQARLQTHAEDQKADAERVGDACRMHAREDLRHAHEPERADDREERAEQDAGPAQRCRWPRVTAGAPCRRRRRGRHGGRTSAPRACR